MLNITFITLSLLFISMFASANKSNIPLSRFSQLPSVELPITSPNGKHIAVILNQDELTQVAILDSDNHANLAVILQSGAEKYRIDEINWANNDRILVTVSQPFTIKKVRLGKYTKQFYRMKNSKVRTKHLYSASIDGKDVFEMRKRVDKKQSALEFYLASPSLLSLLKDDPDNVLVTMNDSRDNNHSSVFKVNVTNGNFEKY